MKRFLIVKVPKTLYMTTKLKPKILFKILKPRILNIKINGPVFINNYNNRLRDL